MIIVEDGTGVSDANSYASVSDLDDYAVHRLDLSGYTNTQKENALVLASSDWVDGYHTFGGEKLASTQGLHFPTELDGLPAEIVSASLKAALLQLQGLLFVNLSLVSQSGDVESESKGLGPLSTSVTYRSGSNRNYSRTIPKDLSSLLRPFLLSSGLGVVHRL